MLAEHRALPPGASCRLVGHEDMGLLQRGHEAKDKVAEIINLGGVLVCYRQLESRSDVGHNPGRMPVTKEAENFSLRSEPGKERSQCSGCELRIACQRACQGGGG